MSKMIIHKNKNEVFKCNLKVDGADVNDTSVRLCLEFDDNKNFFFHGKIQEDGTCTITIPKMPEISSNKTGKLTIEAIADSVYFKLYESEVELKNSVEVEFIKPEIVKETTIQLQNVTKVENKKPEVTKVEKKPEPIKEIPKQKPRFGTFENFVVNKSN